jgi:hypothetical protein
MAARVAMQFSIASVRAFAIAWGVLFHGFDYCKLQSKTTECLMRDQQRADMAVVAILDILMLADVAQATLGIMVRK